MRTPFSYQNNPNLPNGQYQHHFTQHEKDEFLKCMEDPVYFTKTYLKLVHVDKGLVPFKMWDFQEDLLSTFHKNRFTICKFPRQSGKSCVSIAYLLHFVLFNRDVKVAILANRAPTARELLSRLKLSYEYLPMFLKQGICEWNKGSIFFANGSSVLADSTTGGTIRGYSFNIIMLDEFSFVPHNIAESFFASTYPTISSGKTTKVIIVSTPNGIGNLYYKMWSEAVNKSSEFIAKEIHWSQVPGRDQKWKEETIRNTSERQFAQEFECSFLGSTNTLISASKLQTMAIKRPVSTDNNLDIYELPQKKHTYVICVDVAEGQGLDYSAFSIFDVTQVPYIQVAKYRNNEIPPMLYPTVIYQAAKKYNDAFVLVEINSIGLQVADTLHFELSYDNLLKFQIKGKQGQQESGGFGGGRNKIAFGVKTTLQTKNIGCANLKALVENDKLIINDADTIVELSSFSADKKTFRAEEGNNDDLAMTLVHFGWLTSQRHFKDTIHSNIREVLQKQQFDLMDTDIVPFGIIDKGQGETDGEWDANGDFWTADRKRAYEFGEYYDPHL